MIDDIKLPTGRRPEKCDAFYARMRGDCAIVTASDSKHAPYLFNALTSLDVNFPNRPAVTIFDIGLSRLQRADLSRMSNVNVVDMPHFVPHWKVNWSWKLQAMAAAHRRYILYLDLPNFVVLRSLASWFAIIHKHGYIVISNGQELDDITPSNYWCLHNLEQVKMGALPTFGAGIIGFDRESKAGRAIYAALARTIDGLNLGRSPGEQNGNYKPLDLVRDCRCFRADQTLLNLAFREHFGFALHIRKAARYCGAGGRFDHTGQHLWYARRAYESLLDFRGKPYSLDFLRILNRLCWSPSVQLNRIARAIATRQRRSRPA